MGPIAPAQSAVDADEEIAFFTTSGHLEETGEYWCVRIHGWVYEPEHDSIRRAAALGVLRRVLGLDEGAAETALFRERARLFLVDNERDERIRIRSGGRTHELEPSGANGHTVTTLRIAAADVRSATATAASRGYVVAFEAALAEGDGRRFGGTVQLVPPKGVSVISDIDDTIKVTDVRDRKALLANTFLRDFRAVPGMADVYRAWADHGAVFHYVSASPWQLYGPLSGFLRAEGFPAGSFHMKLFRLKDSTFFDLFADPEVGKTAAIETILTAFPERRFVLVGDSGEKDPEIYGRVARKHPRQIDRIFVRNVTGEDAGGERFRAAFDAVPRDQRMLFRNANELPRRLGSLEGE